MTSYFDPLTESAIGTASKTMNSKQQMNLLDLTKTVAESALQFMYAAKEGGGNPKVCVTERERETEMGKGGGGEREKERVSEVVSDQMSEEGSE